MVKIDGLSSLLLPKIYDSSNVNVQRYVCSKLLVVCLNYTSLEDRINAVSLWFTQYCILQYI
jgi:hypothetical protein